MKSNHIRFKFIVIICSIICLWGFALAYPKPKEIKYDLAPHFVYNKQVYTSSSFSEIPFDLSDYNEIGIISSTVSPFEQASEEFSACNIPIDTILYYNTNSPESIFIIQNNIFFEYRPYISIN